MTLTLAGYSLSIRRKLPTVAGWLDGKPPRPELICTKPGQWCLSTLCRFCPSSLAPLNLVAKSAHG